MPLTKITNTGLADDAVTSDKVADGVISAADVADGTLTNAKLANSDITINGTSIALGASGEIVAGTDWQAVTVADGSTTLNAEAGKGYFLDTNAGVIEVFLPSSPTRGDKVVLADYSGTFATNQIIINTGGELLDSTAGNDFKVTTNNSIVELIYVDSAKGWLVKLNQAAGTTPSGATSVISTFGSIYNSDNVAQFTEATGGTITTSGDFKIHTFTGDGCFVVSQVGSDSIFPGCASAGPDAVDYLVVAGGGGGGGDVANQVGGGGGGAGGYRTTFPSPNCNAGAFPITTQTYPITVGGGGSANNDRGVPGSNSVFSTITSTGGGGGGGGGPGPGPYIGLDGGSGGGAKSGSTAGAGNTPPVSPPQGNPGGGCSPGAGGEGGGGAAQAGGTSAPDDGGGGAGGNGSPNSITGSDVTYAGGGGGAGGGDACRSNAPGAGGSGGGGAGGRGNPGSTDGTAGSANTGGGGGAGGACHPGPAPGSGKSGAAGGKGIVIIRYKFQ